MKTKITKLISGYKTEIRELKKNPEYCTRGKNPVVFGCIQTLNKVILDLEWILLTIK